MNERRDFDISKYLKDDKVCLENLRIENCRIAGLQSEWAKKELVIIKCILDNVVFDNHCGRGYVNIQKSEFINCVFHDTLGSGNLEVRESIFTNCTFADMNIRGVSVSSVAKCHFTDCDFNNVDLKWNFSLYESEINGGKIDHCSIAEGYVSEIKVSDLQIEHVQLNGAFEQNRMESVIFKDVLLVGSMGEAGSEAENVFIDCDMDGFMFKEGSLGFESLGMQC